MMPQELLATLADLGASVRADGQQLKIDAPRGAIHPDLLAEIRRHKADLLNLLTANDPPANPAPTEPTTAPLTFWDRMAACRPDHELYLNHILACKDCNARFGRYCQQGQILHATYESHLQ
ncbi:MAG: hypothetical protein PSX71_01750 [bacterium]|nr:hypothetical protein [bacterium]